MKRTLNSPKCQELELSVSSRKMVQPFQQASHYSPHDTSQRDSTPDLIPRLDPADVILLSPTPSSKRSYSPTPSAKTKRSYDPRTNLSTQLGCKEEDICWAYRPGEAVPSSSLTGSLMNFDISTSQNRCLGTSCNSKKLQYYILLLTLPNFPKL